MPFKKDGIERFHFQEMHGHIYVPQNNEISAWACTRALRNSSKSNRNISLVIFALSIFFLALPFFTAHLVLIVLSRPKEIFPTSQVMLHPKWVKKPFPDL